MSEQPDQNKPAGVHASSELPTMTDLDTMAAELDEIDATLEALNQKG